VACSFLNSLKGKHRHQEEAAAQEAVAQEATELAVLVVRGVLVVVAEVGIYMLVI
jgi:hypothetical protein